MINIILLSELLKLRGLDLNKKVKVVRHKDDSRFDVERLKKLDQLKYYQCHQEQNKFQDCDYVVTFIGIEKGKAKLVGVYKVLSCIRTKEWFIPENFIYKNSFKDSNFYYEMEEVKGFQDLIDRVVIDWGPGAINWAQWLDPAIGKDKVVVEVLPEGYFKAFPGYDALVINHEELKEIINTPDSNKEWHTMLSAVGGVYLIVDKCTGRQYVGSAYGKEGLLGRWKKYAQNGHGGNKELMVILEGNPSNLYDF